MQSRVCCDTAQLINHCTPADSSAAITAALRPSVVFVFADPGLPLEALLQRLCCCFGLAHIDMDKLARAATVATHTRGNPAAVAAAKSKNSYAPLPAAVTCPALLDKIAALQEEGTCSTTKPSTINHDC